MSVRWGDRTRNELAAIAKAQRSWGLGLFSVLECFAIVSCFFAILISHLCSHVRSAVKIALLYSLPQTVLESVMPHSLRLFIQQQA